MSSELAEASGIPGREKGSLPYYCQGFSYNSGVCLSDFFHQLYGCGVFKGTLPKTNSSTRAPENGPKPNRKGSSPNHQLSGASC